MNKLVLIGGGGHCKSVLDTIIRSKKYDDIVIVDPNIPVEKTILGKKVVGSDVILKDLKMQGFNDAFVTVGNIDNCLLRIKLANIAAKLGFHFPVIIDPSAVVSSSANIGEGTFVGKLCVINADTVIGSHCIINTGAIVEHDSRIGNFVHTSVGSVLCGGCHIGDESFIGANSTVIQEIRIGKKVVIGANSTILKNVDDEERIYGLKS